jgi:predicted ATPase
LQTIVKGANRQVIITTHSPIILNYLEPEDIFFLWKDKDGAINGRKMFSAEEMRESLDFLNPGEIWFNYGKDEIISRLTKSDKEENVNK